MTTQEKNATHWQNLASNYDEVMSGVPQMHALHTQIINSLPLNPKRIMDLGTGTGALIEKIIKIYPDCEVVGLDPAPAMLQQARSKFKHNPLITFLECSAHKIDAPNNYFDAIVSNYALHHLTDAQKILCANEIYRILLPQGRLIYGDQHCRKMGEPEDKAWVEDMFDLLCAKARHYLHTASLERMLLQIELIPKFLLKDGEILATVEYWCHALQEAGFSSSDVITLEPANLFNRVIIATK